MRVSKEPRDREAELGVRDVMRQALYEENIAEFWERLYTRTENLPLVTQVKKSEIPNYVGALWYAKLFDLDWLNDLVEYDLALRVSIDRKGRQEATKVLVGNAEREARATGAGFLSRLFAKKEDGGA